MPRLCPVIAGFGLSGPLSNESLSPVSRRPGSHVSSSLFWEASMTRVAEGGDTGKVFCAPFASFIENVSQACVGGEAGNAVCGHMARVLCELWGPGSFP